MLILALDIATNCGFAYGPAGGIPRSGVVVLKRPKDIIEIAPFNLVAWLRDLMKRGTIPDLVVVEAYISIASPIHKSAASIELQVQCHGAIQAYCRCHGIRIEKVPTPTIRKHFCGRAHAGDRAETKRMVVQRCVQLGYLPRGCLDDNRADACAVFDWAAVHLARVAQQHLVFFEAVA